MGKTHTSTTLNIYDNWFSPFLYFSISDILYNMAIIIKIFQAVD